MNTGLDEKISSPFQKIAILSFELMYLKGHILLFDDWSPFNPWQNLPDTMPRQLSPAESESKIWC